MMDQLRLIAVDQGNPVQTARALLGTIWTRGELAGMLVPVWSKEHRLPELALVNEPARLDGADPFATIMLSNAASMAADLAQAEGRGRLGFVLRPCEERTLQAIANQRGIDLSSSIIICPDCLGVLPEEDIQWRIGAIDDQELASLNALAFAHQGGILPSRFKTSCQLCERPTVDAADVCLHVIGIDTSRHLLVAIRNKSLAAALAWNETPADNLLSPILARRQVVCEQLSRWRRRSLLGWLSRLDDSQSSVEGLQAHLEECAVCEERLRSFCPSFGFDGLIETSTTALRALLPTCSGCGMCEHACPQGFPLFASIACLKHRLQVH